MKVLYKTLSWLVALVLPVVIILSVVRLGDQPVVPGIRISHTRLSS